MTTAATKLPFEVIQASSRPFDHVLMISDQLKDGSLFHQQSFVGGKWIDAKSGKRFDVIDPGNDKAFASCPDNNADDVPAAAEASYAAFQKYSKVNPRQRAKWLLEWHRLIDENQVRLTVPLPMGTATHHIAPGRFGQDCHSRDRQASV